MANFPPKEEIDHHVSASSACFAVGPNWRIDEGRVLNQITLNSTCRTIGRIVARLPNARRTRTNEFPPSARPRILLSAFLLSWHFDQLLLERHLVSQYQPSVESFRPLCGSEKPFLRRSRESQ
jgi:hypothetical protein